MSEKLDRTGEKNINKFGSEMVIVEYRTNKDIDIYFPEYDWTAESVQYCHFKKGAIKCPYEPTIYGIGYIGEGKHKVYDENGKTTKCYNTWYDMLKRCYDPKYHEKEPTYTDCEASKEFHNFQNFGDWFIDDYYEIEGEIMCLDKDILRKDNKIYSPENCVFVPKRINNLFTKRNSYRGSYPIGVHYHKRNKKFTSYCRYENKKKHLGNFDTPQQAFNSYKQFKEQYIKQVADEYKDKIPEKLYQAMHNYEVEMTD